MKKCTIEDILTKKKNQKKITMLTAYDYPLGKLIDQSHVDMILVGDSLANVVLGLDSTRDVCMDEMLHHAKAVSRAVERAVLIGDMPYCSFQKDVLETVADAKRFQDEAKVDAVKVEWFDGVLDVTRAIIEAGISVMGHVGLTPQTAEKFTVQGKDHASAQTILEQAEQLEEAGCFAIVLECVPTGLAQKITNTIAIPTIGIGAGVHCDGQVLVTHDVLGLFDRFQPKFAKQYVHLSPDIVKVFNQYCDEVQTSQFPTDQHSFSMNKEDLEKIQEL